MPAQIHHERGLLAAAAMMARNGRLTVRVVLPRVQADVGFVAEIAAEQAGVDAAVDSTMAGTTVHFVARHQDRAVRPRSRHSVGKLRRIVDWARPKRRHAPGADSLDLLTFHAPRMHSR